MLNKESLQLVVVECFLAELDVLVADICKHGRLRVQVVILTCLRNDTPLDVAEKDNAVHLRAESSGQKGLQLSGIHHLEGLRNTIYILSLVASLRDDRCLGFVLFLTHFLFKQKSINY